MIALYSALGGFLLLLTSSLWNEAEIALGLPTPLILPRMESIKWGILSFLASMCSLSAVMNVLTKKVEPAIISIINVAVTGIIYMVTTCIVFGSVIASWWALLFTFVNAGIIGCSTYLNYDLSIRKMRHVDNPKKEKEALKLEHDWILRVVSTVTYAATILLATVIFGTFSQITIPSVPMEQRGTLAFFEFFLASSIQVIYVCVGFWFGILGKLLGYSWSLHERIREI